MEKSQVLEYAENANINALISMKACIEKQERQFGKTEETSFALATIKNYLELKKASTLSTMEDLHTIIRITLEDNKTLDIPGIAWKVAAQINRNFNLNLE